MMLGWIYTDLERLYNTIDSGENLSFVQMAEEYNSLVMDLTEQEKNFGVRPIDLVLCSNNFNALRENVYVLLTKLKKYMD